MAMRNVSLRACNTQVYARCKCNSAASQCKIHLRQKQAQKSITIEDTVQVHDTDRICQAISKAQNSIINSLILFGFLKSVLSKLAVM